MGGEKGFYLRIKIQGDCEMLDRHGFVSNALEQSTQSEMDVRLVRCKVLEDVELVQGSLSRTLVRGNSSAATTSPTW